MEFGLNRRASNFWKIAVVFCISALTGSSSSSICTRHTLHWPQLAEEALYVVSISNAFPRTSFVSDYFVTLSITTHSSQHRLLHHLWRPVLLLALIIPHGLMAEPYALVFLYHFEGPTESHQLSARASSAALGTAAVVTVCRNVRPMLQKACDSFLSLLLVSPD